VKGTTSAGTDVILTRAEVEKQRRYYPHNALVVVHSIKLDRTGSKPTTSGGVLHCTSPWAVQDEDLTVISYAYRTQVGNIAAGEEIESPHVSQPQEEAQEAEGIDGGRNTLLPTAPTTRAPLGSLYRNA
jgi:hypothetical protein